MLPILVLANLAMARVLVFKSSNPRLLLEYSYEDEEKLKTRDVKLKLLHRVR